MEPTKPAPPVTRIFTLRRPREIEGSRNALNDPKPPKKEREKSIPNIADCRTVSRKYSLASVEALTEQGLAGSANRYVTFE